MKNSSTVLRIPVAMLLLVVVFFGRAASPALANSSGNSSTEASSVTTSVSNMEGRPIDATQIVRALVEPATVFLYVEFSAYVWDHYNGQYISDEPFTVGAQCSGFVVNPNGYIVTAGHCVDVSFEVRSAIIDAAAVYAYESHYYVADFTLEEIRSIAMTDYGTVSSDDEFDDADRKVSVYTGVSVSGIDVAKESQARVIEVRPFEEGDVALIKIEGTDMPIVELGTGDTIEIGTGVVSVGYAGSVQDVTDFSLAPSFKDGSISSKRTIGDGLVTVFETSTALSGGMSGGPTVDDLGMVLGVNSFKIRDETQAFNFITPVSIVKEVLLAQGIQNESDGTNQTYRDGILAYFNGERESAIESLEQVLEAQPGHPLAQEFLTKARQLPVEEVVEVTTTTTDLAATTDDQNDSSASPAPLVIGLLIAAVLAVGTTAVVRRQKAPAASQPKTALSSPDPLQRLETLSDLFARGHLSEHEFQMAKASVLNNMGMVESPANLSALSNGHADRIQV